MTSFLFLLLLTCVSQERDLAINTRKEAIIKASVLRNILNKYKDVKDFEDRESFVDWEDGEEFKRFESMNEIDKKFKNLDRTYNNYNIYVIEGDEEFLSNLETYKKKILVINLRMEVLNLDRKLHADSFYSKNRSNFGITRAGFVFNFEHVKLKEDEYYKAKEINQPDQKKYPKVTEQDFELRGNFK